MGRMRLEDPHWGGSTGRRADGTFTHNNARLLWAMRFDRRVDGLLHMVTPREILSYWFGDSNGTGRPELWFGGGPEVDAEIRGRFSTDVEEAVGGRLDGWARNPRGRLALVLLLDQLNRHVHRGTPAAFQGDHAAQRQTMKALAKSEDVLLRPFERAFLYMPLQHAEDRHLQERGVACFERLLHEVPRSQQGIFAGFLEHARDHASIVERFGRFPDRNRLLGRTSTAEEERFLVEEPRGWFEPQQ